MTIDFPQGVPDGCVEWLEQHVGPGRNFEYGHRAWYHDCRFRPYDEQIHDGQQAMTVQGDYIPSITIRDGNSREALWFALRWSSE